MSPAFEHSWCHVFEFCVMTQVSISALTDQMCSLYYLGQLGGSQPSPGSWVCVRRPFSLSILGHIRAGCPLLLCLLKLWGICQTERLEAQLECTLTPAVPSNTVGFKGPVQVQGGV